MESRMMVLSDAFWDRIMLLSEWRNSDFRVDGGLENPI